MYIGLLSTRNRKKISPAVLEGRTVLRKNLATLHKVLELIYSLYWPFFCVLLNIQGFMLLMNVYPGTILTVFFFIFRGFFNLNCTFSKIDNFKKNLRNIIIFFLCSKYLFINLNLKIHWNWKKLQRKKHIVITRKLEIVRRLLD